MVQIRYDGKADALAIDFGESRARPRTVRVTDTVRLDFDRDGRLLSVEVLDASFHVPRAELEQLDAGEEWLTLQDAAQESGLAPATLRVQLNHGRLKGKKRGRDWFVERAALLTYLESRSARGRPATSGPRRTHAAQPPKDATSRRAKVSGRGSRRKAAAR
jgi:uncharacterized protein YuzE